MPIQQLNPEALWAHYGDTLIYGALNFIAAIAILLVGLWVSSRLARAVRRFASKHERVDETLAAFFSWIVRYTIIAFVVVAVLGRFGVQTTSIIAVLGAAALAIGLALQGTLSNVAAGVMLILFRPYRLGDAVELAGKTGQVRDVTLFTTELVAADNTRIVLPNAQCWGAPILNFTAHATRRVEVEFGVAYETDLGIAIDVILKAVTAHPCALLTPPPEVYVKRLSDATATLEARAWCASSDYFTLKSELTKTVKDALDAAGIDPKWTDQQKNDAYEAGRSSAPPPLQGRGQGAG